MVAFWNSVASGAGVGVGLGLGLGDGLAVGVDVGVGDGEPVGDAVGDAVGETVGATVAVNVGVGVGAVSAGCWLSNTAKVTAPPIIAATASTPIITAGANPEFDLLLMYLCLLFFDLVIGRLEINSVLCANTEQKSIRARDRMEAGSLKQSLQ